MQLIDFWKPEELLWGLRANESGQIENLPHEGYMEKSIVIIRVPLDLPLNYGKLIPKF